MPEGRRDNNARQALLAFCLYAVSFMAFLVFCIDVMFGSLTDVSVLIAVISLWLLSGVLAVRTQFFYIDRKAWERVALCRWERRNRETLATGFFLWNILNIVVLAIDATLRKTGANSAAYPWFMLASISLGYVTLLWRCAALGFPSLNTRQEPEK